MAKKQRGKRAKRTSDVRPAVDRRLSEWLERFRQLAAGPASADEGASHLVAPEEYRGAVTQILSWIGRFDGATGFGDDEDVSVPALVRSLEDAGVTGLTEAAVIRSVLTPETRALILEGLAERPLHGHQSPAAEALLDVAHLLRDLQDEPAGGAIDEAAARFRELSDAHRALVLDVLAHRAGRRAGPFLQRIAGQDEAVDTRLVEIAAGWGTEESVPLLRAVDRPEAGRGLRKAIGRAYYSLRARGVETGERPSTGGDAHISFDTGVELTALASTPDWRGQQLVLLGGLPGTRGFAVAQALLDERQGVGEFAVYRMSRADLRDMVDRANRQHSVLLRHVPVEHAFFLVEEAVRTARDAGRDLPGELLYWRGEDFWNRVDPDRYEHPVRTALGPDDGGPPPWGPSDWEEFMALDPLAAWTLGPEDVDVAWHAVSEPSSGGIILPGALQQERESDAFRRTLVAAFPPDRCARYRRRLEETALLLHLEGSDREARMALHAADEFVRLSDRIWEHPVAEAILRRDLERRRRAEEEARSRDVPLIQSPWDRRGRGR